MVIYMCMLVDTVELVPLEVPVEQEVPEVERME
jgi:hypothetical protein